MFRLIETSEWNTMKQDFIEKHRIDNTHCMLWVEKNGSREVWVNCESGSAYERLTENDKLEF